MDKKDIVIAAAGNYSWEHIEVWALSLITSGFNGVGAVIIYDDPNNISEANQYSITNLKALGFQVIVTALRGTVFNQRFYDFAEVLKATSANLRYAIVTDIRDIYFQSDPFQWLADNLSKPMLAVSEGIRYRDEPWGRENVQNGFPTLASRIMDKCIYNVGVLAGEVNAVADMCLAVASMAKSTGFPVADQSGYNLLLDMHPYVDANQICNSEDGFACLAGTMADPLKIDNFRPFHLEPEPFMDSDGVKTSTGKLYPIVHQYDRVPIWRDALLRKLSFKLQPTENIQ